MFLLVCYTCYFSEGTLATKEKFRRPYATVVGLVPGKLGTAKMIAIPDYYGYFPNIIWSCIEGHMVAIMQLLGELGHCYNDNFSLIIKTTILWISAKECSSP